jgi:hypothetical protein
LPLDSPGVPGLSPSKDQNPDGHQVGWYSRDLNRLLQVRLIE